MRARFGIFIAFFLTIFSATAGDSTPASRADAAFRLARQRYQSDPSNTMAAWQFGSACFDQAEFARNDTDRARIANLGINACRNAATIDPKLAPAHYYLGMNLAQLARTKLMGALSILSEVEQEWKTTIQLDENFDYAGADRNLGLLYSEAPGWPLSIGSRANARQHLLRAIHLNADYPENHLNLIEAYIKWGNTAEAGAAAKKLETVLPAAQKKFAGDAWESNWSDWNKRWTVIQTKLNKIPDPMAPHQRK